MPSRPFADCMYKLELNVFFFTVKFYDLEPSLIIDPISPVSCIFSVESMLHGLQRTLKNQHREEESTEFPVLWSGLVSRVGASRKGNKLHLSNLDTITTSCLRFDCPMP